MRIRTGIIACSVFRVENVKIFLFFEKIKHIAYIQKKGDCVCEKNNVFIYEEFI